MIEFDAEALQDKANNIVQRLLSQVIHDCLSEFFGVRTRFGRVEVETYYNRDGSRDFVNRLMVKPIRAKLQQKFADQVMAWIKRSPKTKKILDEIVNEAEKRWSFDEYSLREKLREAISTIAHEHAKEDFLAILHQVGDNLQKELVNEGTG